MMRTSECVTPKHPDKICDRISDAILDACIIQDEYSRVAVESMGGHGIVTITGEITTTAQVDIPSIVRKIVGNDIGVQVNLVKQSPEIARGVDDGGAGDQGIVVGYACRENELFLPMEHYLAKELCKYLYKFHPEDGKTQITIDDSKELPEITEAIASFANTKTVILQSEVGEFIEKMVKEGKVGKPSLLSEIRCNTAGEWDQGGFDADTGVTGRKIVVDAYGPSVPVGGGAFSGKDPTKVDRSGAYFARSLAVSFIKRHSELKWVKIHMAFAIGVNAPVMVEVRGENLDGSPYSYKMPNFTDLSIDGFINGLDLRKGIYEKTAEWGPFGNGFSWDQ